MGGRARVELETTLAAMRRPLTADSDRNTMGTGCTTKYVWCSEGKYEKLECVSDTLPPRVLNNSRQRTWRAMHRGDKTRGSGKGRECIGGHNGISG